MEACGKKHAAKGYCLDHYCRMKRRPHLGVERSADGNESAQNDLTEWEFVQMKELRENGVPAREAAFELRKGITVVAKAWQYATHRRYVRRERDDEE